jgi:hypothetical protein
LDFVATIKVEAYHCKIASLELLDSAAKRIPPFDFESYNENGGSMLCIVIKIP